MSGEHGIGHGRLEFLRPFIGEEMYQKKILFSEQAQSKIRKMYEKIIEMFQIAKDAFENFDKTQLPKLATLENEVDMLKKQLTTSHFMRLAEGSCQIESSPYYSSAIAGLERVADHAPIMPARKPFRRAGAGAGGVRGQMLRV